MRFILIIAMTLLVSCGNNNTPLQPIENQRELVILTRIGITTYAVDDLGSASGFEHDLVQKFAEDQGLQHRIIVAASDADLLNRLKQNEAHLAIAWTTPPDEPGIRSSIPYFQSRSLIVRHEASLPVSKIQQLAHRTVQVIAGSRQETMLQAMANQIPGLKIVPVHRSNELDLMEKVASQRIGTTLLSDAAFDIGNNFYPDLQGSLELGTTQPISWLFAPNAAPELIAKANDFLERLQRSGEMDRLKDRYFGHVDRLTADNTGRFIESIRTRLPQYRPYFQEAQLQTGIDWRLLAALAYQESRWDPLATSPTGVRGMMMLTEDTADHLGVKNRLDPAQSIRAGAYYLSELRDALPAHIREPDRLWLALAAYNLGMGHLNAARSIARSLGTNPDAWFEMKKVLPLLAKPQYFRRLKSGKGRGGEAVIMTENVRLYADILNRFAPRYEPTKRKSDKFIWKSFQAHPDTDATLSAP